MKVSSFHQILGTLFLKLRNRVIFHLLRY